MERLELIKRVASGLKNMNHVPDYLLFFDDKSPDFSWDEETICGIPVLHSHNSINPGYDGDDYFVQPVFKTESSLMEVYYFQKGFKEI
jgi:hypothetical protein